MKIGFSHFVVTVLAIIYIFSGGKAVPAQTDENDEPLIAFSDFLNGDGEIYLQQVDGTRLLNLTNHPEKDWQPVWSPNGEWIAFASMRLSKPDEWKVTDIFAIRPDGTDLRHLGSANSWYDSLIIRWSPNSKWVEIEFAGEGNAGLYFVSVEDGTTFNLPYPPKPESVDYINPCLHSYEGYWSPDSQWYYCDYLYTAEARGSQYKSQLYRVNLNTRDVEVLGIFDGAIGIGMTFSPDGKQLAFVRRLERTHIDYLEIMDTESGQITLSFSQEGLSFGSLVWSASGESLIIGVSKTEFQRNTPIYLYQINVDGTNLIPLTDSAEQIRYPVFAPNGEYLAFVSYLLDSSDPDSALYLVNSNGTNRRRLTDNAIGQPAWSLDGEWIYFRRGDYEQQEVFRIHPDGGDEQLVAYTSYGWPVPVFPLAQK